MVGKSSWQAFETEASDVDFSMKTISIMKCSIVVIALFDFKWEKATHKINSEEKALVTKATGDALDISEGTTVGDQALIKLATVLTETKGPSFVFTETIGAAEVNKDL